MLVLVIVKQIISDKSPRSSFFPKPKRAGESRGWRPRDSAGFGKMPKVGGDKGGGEMFRFGRETVGVTGGRNLAGLAPRKVFLCP